MSSMHRKTTIAVLALLAFTPALAHAQDGSDDTVMGEDGRQWDKARADLSALPPGDMAMAIERWKILSKSAGYSFYDYSSFLLVYPGLPEEAKLRGHAEAALDREAVPPQQIVTYFSRFPAQTNSGRAHYALALYALGRPEAGTAAREAWRGGPMSDAAEAALFARIGPSLTQADHDARMDALLWAGAASQAERQIINVSPARRATFAARLAMAKGQDPASLALTAGPEAAGDAGYVYNRSRYLRNHSQPGSAATVLINRPRFAVPPREPRKWIAELLAVARKSDASTAVAIAGSVDDMFAPGTDVSRQSFAVRDDYTSLMWLGGTKALWAQGDGRRAAPLFYRYGMAARSPQTRAKGFYWAGRALAQAGDKAGAAQYFELAGQYPDQYYGMLALERLGRALPPLASAPSVVPTAQQRAAFEARPLTRAVRELARESDWPTAVRFFKEIADQAETEADHVLVADLARQIGRRDLGVILGQAAHSDGFGNFRTISFPLIPVPQGANWTAVHMITRQESQFAMNAVSHAGARGLMQLMPGTAREQAGKMGLSYDRQALTLDAGYNLTLGSGYFMRMLDYYNGCWPLAIAAYNAGPGNVNKWLRLNGDPRNGGIDWVEWIEKIPITETRGYVQRVLENAVVYEALYPGRASYKGANPLSHFLGKPYPG
ncbi:MAG: lytic transglycosylase domain-containing protein [Novosphingobium sp.]|uniref:lytic transglycosylase domain-containing protein n=1 Tax=Novosphingobium sp. TaxID=1874826 RepID=UPI0032B9FCE5